MLDTIGEAIDVQVRQIILPKGDTHDPTRVTGTMEVLRFFSHICMCEYVRQFVKKTSCKASYQIVNFNM